ncbi:MAG: hypothetical protein ACRD1X_22200 [Vicinamibacteria bacterium]
MERDEALREMQRVQDEVDSLHLLNGFDFALGWLLGKGVPHDTAIDWIDAWADADELTWAERERAKQMEADEKNRRAMIEQCIKNVSE